MLKSNVVAAIALATCGTSFLFSASVAKAQAVTGNANYSGAVETSGVYATTSFQAAGNASDTYPAFGVVAFNASSFASLASTGVIPSATLTATEYTSTSAATHTYASTIDIYFAELPATGASLGDYDTTNEPGGFDASNFDADYVGYENYANVSNQVDTIPLSLSPADVSYIDGVLSGGSGSFEFFTVETTAGGSARYDGTYSGGPAVLTLNGAAVPEPASLAAIGLSCMALLGRRRRV